MKADDILYCKKLFDPKDCSGVITGFPGNHVIIGSRFRIMNISNEYGGKNALLEYCIVPMVTNRIRIKISIIDEYFETKTERAKRIIKQYVCI